MKEPTALIPSIVHWIKVEDRLPEPGEQVLVFGELFNFLGMYQAVSHGNGEFRIGNEVIPATHWIRLELR